MKTAFAAVAVPTAGGFMPEDFEPRIAQALSDSGGPPELAPQLVALAVKHGLESRLLDWVRFHVGKDWSGVEFELWALKLIETREALARLQEVRSGK